MWSTIKQLWNDAAEKGMKVPYLHDPVRKQPSITLAFPYITFLGTFISIIFLHFYPTILLATMATMVFWIISVIFYLMRNLQKAKVDLDDKSFELESSPTNKDTN